MSKKHEPLMEGERRCNKCGVVKDIQDFTVSPTSRGGRRPECRDCKNAARQVWRKSHQERNTDLWQKSKARQQECNRRGVRALRAELLERYGGACKCCGETHPQFLSIDHIHNDGKADRVKTGYGSPFYAHLLKIGCPTDRYQLLCHNCNMAKAFYGNCPHGMGQFSIVSMAREMLLLPH